MRNTLIFLLTVAMIVYYGNDINWQGTGNMTQDNLTQIWNYINTSFDKSWTYQRLIQSSDTTLVNFTIDFSNHLNKLWDPAWNVVTVYDNSDGTYDTVMYGYAFREHWMWYNGFKLNDGSCTTFIIWKDYNCIRWISLNFNATAGIYAASYVDSAAFNAFKSVFKSLYSTVKQNDIWSASKAYADKLSTDAVLKSVLRQSAAFSIILSPTDTVTFYGRFCVKNYIMNYYTIGSNPNWGRGMILQMR